MYESAYYDKLRGRVYGFYGSSRFLASSCILIVSYFLPTLQIEVFPYFYIYLTIYLYVVHCFSLAHILNKN